MQVSLMVLQSLLILATPVFSQYDIKPDVTFGDHNERFDVTDLVSYQNKYFRADGSIDYRRRHVPKKTNKFLSASYPKEKKWLLRSDRSRQKYAKRIKKEAEDQLNKLANAILLRMKSTRRAGEDFAFDDYGGNVDDFNQNLEQFKRNLDKELHGEIREPTFEYRRVGTVPSTFDYAFPIEMQVEGYLMPPENQ